MPTFPSASPASQPPEMVTLLLVFDVGSSYLTPPNFHWAAVRAAGAAGSPWRLDNEFPPDIRPPLRAPISHDWNPADADLKAVMADLPWCELKSARFIFFLEGLAALRIRARLRGAADACKDGFHTWDNSAHNYERFTVLTRRACREFGELAEKARLLPIFQESRDAGAVHWIYPIFFVSAAPRLYAAEASLQPAIDLGGSHLEFAWIGAQVSPPNADIREVEATFLAAALAWQSLHTLSRLLANVFEGLTLQQEDENTAPEMRLRAIQSTQIFSLHVLDAARPMRWSIRDRNLRVLKALDHGWDASGLRESIGTGNALEQLRLHYEKLETKRRDYEAARRERANGYFRLAAGVLTLLTLFTTIGAVIDLYDPDKTFFKGPRRAVEALMFFVPIIIIASLEWLVWWLVTNQKRGSRSRWVVLVGWLLAMVILAMGVLAAWRVDNWLWTWLPI